MLFQWKKKLWNAIDMLFHYVIFVGQQAAILLGRRDGGGGFDDFGGHQPGYQGGRGSRGSQEKCREWESHWEQMGKPPQKTP